ncbi:MAG TPA: HAD family hydrolase [Phycisphaerae bacterium]|nr:HAD family hydrolase [Phycisphaerae bacterium]
MSGNPAQLRVIVFDLDDTLYPERDYVQSGFEAVARAFEAELRPTFDLATRMKQVFESGDRSRVFDSILGDLHRPPDPALIQRMVDVYRNHQPRIRLFADADAALDRLASRFKLALLSDGYLAAQRRKVDALGLAQRLDSIVLTDELGRDYWKPDPRAFQRLAADLQLCGPQCAYVADNRSKDFVAPNQLGWRSVMVCRPGALYADWPAPAGGQPQFVIDSLNRLPESLASAGPSRPQ